MKLTVTQENLSRALATVSRIASTRGSLPILSNVLLKTDSNQLLVAATNLDVAISETIGAKVKTDGSITVPARLMQDYVASLPSSTLTLEVVDNKLKLTTEHHSSTINGTPADDFPEMPTIDNGSILQLTATDLKTALQQVLFAASSDDARPVLTGLYLHTTNGKLYAVATDSYRLAEKMIGKEEKEVSLLLPASSLQDVLRVMRDDTTTVSVNYDEQQARFSVGSVELVTRLIEGNYPDYRKLLPSEYATTATLNRADLQEITKVSSLFAREAAGGVTVTIEEEKKEVSIRSIASQVGENNAVAEAEVSGDAVITMNSRYILDALNAFEGKKIQVNVNGKLDPCVLTDPENDDYLHVVMPVKS
jgi:DNA polymerase-3 subunit beta